MLVSFPDLVRKYAPVADQDGNGSFQIQLNLGLNLGGVSLQQVWGFGRIDRRAGTAAKQDDNIIMIISRMSDIEMLLHDFTNDIAYGIFHQGKIPVTHLG
ncbi:hypothetical protein J41TS12_25720 [Paenibacillus antibioticophila]|uniref:Uncharacterized protein n=1 Tax=Paenibacillus antibioticophila TaxID=1274374 RepID=A0A919XSP7_9BACL|nr:hypothetical protein J41TS12_25720 [Paenibacillus antibioticophila]